MDNTQELMDDILQRMNDLEFRLAKLDDNITARVAALEFLAGKRDVLPLPPAVVASGHPSNYGVRAVFKSGGV